MTFVIVGLGNPQNKYSQTRHNIGCMVVDAFQKLHGLDGFEENDEIRSLVSHGQVAYRDVALLKPQTFMNKSGLAVTKAVLRQRDQDGLIVVHDDIDLPLSQIQVAYDKSSGGHNGVASVIERLGSQKFMRVRIGVVPTDESGNMNKPAKRDVRDFVLSEFTAEEKQLIHTEVIPDALDAIHIIIEQGREAAMDAYNE
jgi:PTH1 family peptidyl-tRNA hydrolase